MTQRTKSELIAALVEATRKSQVATDKMDEAGSKALGVNRTDGRCMDVIQRTGQITAGDLAREAGLTTGSATTAIDRLVAKGYARRVADPGDRRRVLVELTELAERRAGEIWGPLGERGVPHLEACSVAELETLLRFMRMSIDLNEERAAELHAEPREVSGG